MISSFRLRFGRTPGSAGDEILASPVTIFVGPNNSGKSKVLAEIESFCRLEYGNSGVLILDDVVFSGLGPDEAQQALKRFDTVQSPDGNVYIIVGTHDISRNVPPQHLMEIIQNPHSNVHQFCEWFLYPAILMLDGRTRIDLVNSQEAGDFLSTPKWQRKSFLTLFRDDRKRNEVRRIIYEAFDSYFIIDPTSDRLRVRFSPRAPSSVVEERGLHEEALEFYSQAQLIDNMSDGVKAFTGIIIEMIAGDPHVLLIDEPEAFLHPSLVSKLGSEVSLAASASGKRVFASTHSAAFVMGCVQSGVPVSIVRLTYRDEVATSRVLPSEDILELMRKPLLRSLGVLNGLFYEFVVVAESDTDRVFYQEINERLLRFRPEWGIPNCLFINAQNKQTIPTIVRPLRKLGIPAVGIVDIDVLKNRSNEWKDLLSSVGVPNILRESLGSVKSKIRQSMDETGLDMKRNGGINILDGEEKEAVETLFSQLSDYGIFVVPGGELESWLSSVESSGHGPVWLARIFEGMGEDPSDPGYVKPTDGDVWQFLCEIKNWLINPNRKGIPE
ncbi:MAG: ATPase [Chloroflexi bacterium AL-W]|nr:ATPase [Chloroflexi bacterium AL-W]